MRHSLIVEKIKLNCKTKRATGPRIMLKKKKAIILDMNGTFMFGEDRFGDAEDYSVFYESAGGKLSADVVNETIRAAYNYLSERYPDERYGYNFPSLEAAIVNTLNIKLHQQEIIRLIDTFAFHEHGFIPEDYANALRLLKKYFTLAVVIDIWSPKNRWLNTFEKHGIHELFSAVSFSSDHGMVKPSPKPFEIVVNELGLSRDECVVIGDSVRRDLGGATAAGIDCILVGGAVDERALASFTNLLEICMLIKEEFQVA